MNMDTDSVQWNMYLLAICVDTENSENSEFRDIVGHKNAVFSIEAIKCPNDFNSTKGT